MRKALLLTLVPVLLAAEVQEIAAVSDGHVQRPTWSMDGKQLAYEVNYHDRKIIELWVGDPSSKQFTPVRTSARASSDLTAGFAKSAAAAGVVHEITWAPPQIGRYVFSASNEVFDYDLYVSGGGAIAQAPGADGGAVWSPDGNYIVFTSARTGEGDLYLIDVRAIEKPPRQLTRARTSSELYPSWSAGSDQLVYVGHSKSGDNLWLLPALDGAPVQLTTWSGSQIRPTYAPDGQSIAFYANKEDPQRFDLYVMDARAAAEPRRLASGVVPDSAGPAWTADSARLIAVLDDDAAFDPIAVVDVASGAVKRLDLGTVGHGDLSLAERDGETWLAYVAQGRTTDANRDFKRLFTSPLP